MEISDRKKEGSVVSYPYSPSPGIRKAWIPAYAGMTKMGQWGSEYPPTLRSPSIPKSIGNSRGFTLIELMVVMVIVAITIAVAIPRVGSSWTRMEDREFVEEFVGTLRRSRLIAMNSGEIATFRIRGSERAYGLESPPEKPIPINVDIFAEHLDADPETHDNILQFYPDGSISGSSMEITFDHQRTYRIFIHPLFGTVRVERAEAGA